MNLLTGKAKEHFINYVWSSSFEKEDYKEYENYLDNQKENHTYSDLIEWFDTLGIDINIQSDFEHNFWCRILYGASSVIVGPDFKSRREAIEDGIKKANKIYNER